MPEVSRIVAMPRGIRLDMLHLIIQAAMVWTNTHLWLIHARGSTWGVPDPAFPDDTIPANSTLLLDMIADIGTNRLEYIYDFGDHWSHTIKLVKPLPAVSGIAYPLLIDAVGRCPLEDSGGPPGYMEMLEALRDPAHPRHAEVIEWPGREFDPNDGVYRAQGRYTEAEPLLRRSLAIRERTLGPEHPEVATTLNSLAALHRAQGRYTEAEQLLRRSLAIREKTLGPEHRGVGVALNYLGELQRSRRASSTVSAI